MFSRVATGAMREVDPAHHLLQPSPSLGAFAQQACSEEYREGEGRYDEGGTIGMSYFGGYERRIRRKR